MQGLLRETKNDAETRKINACTVSSHFADFEKEKMRTQLKIGKIKLGSDIAGFYGKAFIL